MSGTDNPSTWMSLTTILANRRPVIDLPFTTALKNKLDGLPDSIESTRLRNSSSTTRLLQAAAMKDHTASSDHDSRYYTKTQIDSQRQQVAQTMVQTNVSLTELVLAHEATITLSVSVPGVVPTDVIVVNIPPAAIGLELAINATITQNDVVLVSVSNVRSKKVKGGPDGKGSLAVPAGTWRFVALRPTATGV